MLHLAACLALVGPQVQETQEAPKPDAKAELSAVCKKVVASGAFAFELVSEEEGGFGGERGPSRVQGTFKKGLPVRLKLGERTVYRSMDALVLDAGEGEWEVFDVESVFGGGGGGDREWMMDTFVLLDAPLPHTSLKDFESKCKDVAVADKEGVKIYSGSLTDQGADEYSGAPRLKDMMQRFGGGDADLDTAGTYEVHVKDGGITKVVLKTSLAADLGGRAIDRKRSTSLSFSKVGKAELEVPEKVLACIEL